MNLYAAAKVGAENVLMQGENVHVPEEFRLTAESVKMF